MTRAPVIQAFLPLALLAPLASASDDVLTLSDIPGDAVPRPTDFDADNDFDIMSLPDLLSLELSGWLPDAPAADRYTGAVVGPDDAEIFRLAITLDGLVNPPGTLGFAGEPYDPHKFGPRPVFGFIDFDVDADMNTGGELDGATPRYLANVARFGATPDGPLKDRVVTQPGQTDDTFGTAPQFERSGADFALVLCGCWEIEIIEILQGDGDDTFEAGERWRLSGRFFERAQGYQAASGTFSSGPPAEGGATDQGLYDPISEILFEHDPATDTTTITFVDALDMPGAALLEGEPQQPWDFDTFNHTSVREGLEDLVFGAIFADPPDAVNTLIEGWEDKNPLDHLDVTKWGVTALLGTAYPDEDPQGALYVWSDSGFDELFGDFNLDGAVDSLDDAFIQSQCDAGPVAIQNFAKEFSLYDTNYDGLIDDADCPGDCPADVNSDGKLNVLDFAAFQQAFSDKDPIADLDDNGIFNMFDFIAFQELFLLGCD